MKTYRSQIEEGTKPEDEQWQELLKSWHNEDPGMTPRLLTQYETTENKSSYAGLVDAAGNITDKHCLDLACGDGSLFPALLPRLGKQGKLTAIDMSTEELNLAKKHFSDPRITFIEASSQRIPLEEASVDIVFCHLALMLMAPIDTALDEITRILKPNGSLHAVTIALPDHREPTKSILGWLRTQVAKKIKHMDQLNMGDPAFTTWDGIQTLFSRHAHLTLSEEPTLFHLQIYKTTEALWEHLQTSYLSRLLKPEEIQTIKKEGLELLTRYQDKNGKILFPFACRRFQATKK